MKKILSFLLALALVLSVSAALAADIDLTQMSWDDLMTLQEQIKKELISRPEYKQVTVPIGAYKVGVDIPAGKWTISGTDIAGIIYWGKSLDEYGVNIPYDAQISDFSHWSEEDSIDWDLVEGTYIVVTISPVIFSPAIPKPLGF